MKLQKLKECDIPVLFDLYYQLTEEKGDYDEMCRVLKEIESNPTYTLFCVYSDDDKLIATASLTKCFDLTGDSKYYYNMENFVVDEKHRGMGVGAFLIKELEKFVIEQNGSYMNFTSSSSRTGAHEFYKKMGYNPDNVKGFKKKF